MKIYSNAIETDRAFIVFRNIQHISWDFEETKVLLKVYSSGGKIVQFVDEDTFNKFMIEYKHYERVNFYVD